HALGLRYRCDLRVEVGPTRVRPDIVFTRRKLAVFVDGCYWHGCPAHSRPPTTNADYWGPKLSRNRERDEVQTRALIDSGWTVVRVWEHVGVGDAARQVLEGLGRTSRVGGLSDVGAKVPSTEGGTTSDRVDT